MTEAQEWAEIAKALNLRGATLVRKWNSDYIRMKSARQTVEATRLALKILDLESHVRPIIGLVGQVYLHAKCPPWLKYDPTKKEFFVKD